MRYTFAFLSLSLAAAQALPAIQVPSVPVLPLAGLPDIFSGNGFNSIAQTLYISASNISTSVDSIASASAKLSAGANASTGASVPAVDLAKALYDTSNIFWSTAYDVERKVCALAYSINQQNLAAQLANLIAGINYQVQSIIKLQQSLVALLAKVADQVNKFTDSEKSILIGAIQAIATAAQASIAPITTLVDGLKAVGLSGFANVVSGLQASVYALAITSGNAQASFH
ncbi:hypothetical protein N0V90_008448 [Kalmusia sp. IMI 367209]|nr:hypothetical protein N0V90_008448 [Kalmusia sp. IMI 367209]